MRGKRALHREGPCADVAFERFLLSVPTLVASQCRGAAKRSSAVVAQVGTLVRMNHLVVAKSIGGRERSAAQVAVV